MSANPRAIWILTPTEELLAERHKLSRSKSQMLAFNASRSTPSPQFTDCPSSLFMVQSREDTISPKLNESPFQSQFPSVSPIPGNSTTSQTTLNDSPTTDSVIGSISTTHSFLVAPTAATPSPILGQEFFLSRQSFPSSGNLGTPFSAQPAPNISVSISASLTSSPAPTQVPLLSCPIFGCHRTFTKNHEYKCVPSLFISCHIQTCNLY
jgi:hypothetical protein